MKSKSLILTLILAAFFIIGCTEDSTQVETTVSTDQPKQETPVSEVAPVEAGSEAETLGFIGTYLAFNSGFVDFGFSDEEIAAVMAGFQKALEEKPTQQQIAEMMPRIREYMTQKRDAQIAKDKMKNKKEAVVFVAKLKGDPEVKFTESGLGYKIINPGSADEKPTMDDSVSVNYRGTLIDGTEFDASMDPENPVTFPLNGVIPGFSEGLQLIGKGGEIELYIPSELGYGDNPRPGSPIGAGALLVFELTIRDIQKKELPKPEVPENAPPPPPIPTEE